MTDEFLRGTQLIYRACNLLRLFTRQQPEWSLVEAAHQVGLHPATTYRILQAWTREGILIQDEVTGKYRLGYWLLKLGELARQSNDLIRIATPHAEKLAEKTGETIIVDVLDRRMQVVTLVFVPSSFRVAANPSYDKPTPAHVLAGGKVLLADLEPEQLEDFIGRGLAAVTEKSITDPEKLREELEKVRRQGYATNFEEQEISFNAVGAPIRDATGKVVAALSLGGPSGRLTQEGMPEMVALVKETARLISADLGYEEARSP